MEFVDGLTLSIVTGVAVPGTNAIFIELFEYGPVIPGPERKKPNASLKPAFTNSGYSSDAKTYLKLIVSPEGMKSNSKIAPFVGFAAEIAFKSGSPETFGVAGTLLEKEPELLGPTAAIPFPDVSNTPVVIGKDEPLLLKNVTFPWGVCAFTADPL